MPSITIQAADGAGSFAAYLRNRGPDLPASWC